MFVCALRIDQHSVVVAFDDIRRPHLRFIEDAADIFTYDSQSEQLHASKEQLPNVLGIQMHSRPVDFSQKIDLYLDSTENSRVGIYINKRPYIESSISMVSCE